MTIQDEIKGGYKKTDLGTIPQDWDVARIVDVASITTGSRNTQDRLNTGIYPFFVRSQTVERINSYSFDGEAVLTAGDGVGTGKIFHYINGKFDLHQRVYQISNFSPRLNGFFFYLYFANKFFDRIMSMTAKSSVDSVRREMIADMLMPLPPLAEQRAIAAALADADALIAALEGVITKKRDLKRAALQHLLTGKTRLPGFSGKWEVRTLLEVCSGRKELFDDGDWIESEHIANKGIRLIQTGNIGIGRFIDKDDRKYISENSFVLLRCKEVFRGDLLICRLADPAGRACVLPEIGEEKIVTSVDVTIARPDAKLANRIFLANLMSTPEWFRAVSDRSGGTTHKRIARGALGKISLFLPPIAEQTAIAEVLSDMDADLAALEAKVAKARAVKQGMMQELLTGRVRLV